jgi:prepilin-type N-terminal cleavage/methylation domain-containing protein
VKIPNSKSQIPNSYFLLPTSKFHQGFTLTETIVAIFIFSLLMGAVSGMILMLYRTHSYEWQQSLAVEEARRGIETMVKEIREAREGENGAYPIEYAGDKEFIFYSDVDNDGKTERVRYFLGEIQTETFTNECQSNQKGGSCSVSFSNFIKENGKVTSATLKVTARGDLNSTNEYLTISVNGQQLSDTICSTGCSQCSTNFEGLKTFDVTDFAKTGSLNITAKASCPNSKVESKCVDVICDSNTISFKARFELTVTQEIQTGQLKKGVIKAFGTPPTYPLDQEKISIITSYVRNTPPIFEYFDENGNKIEDYPARLKDTKVMKVFLVVNVNPNRPPTEYQLESYVQLRNLK